VFESRLLRNIFGPEKDEVTVELRRLHYEELCVLYFSPNTIQVIKSRIMRYLGHIARMKDRRGE